MKNIARLVFAVFIALVAIWGLERALDSPESSATADADVHGQTLQTQPLDEIETDRRDAARALIENATAVSSTLTPGASSEPFGMLEARVIDADGAPIAGAELTIIDRVIAREIDRTVAPRSISGVDGRVSLAVHSNDRAKNHAFGATLASDEWSIEVECSAPEHDRVRESAVVRGSRPTELGDIVLHAGGALHGHVRLPVDTAAPRVLVNLLAPDLSLDERQHASVSGLWNKRPIASTQMASDGTYGFANVPCRTCRVALVPIDNLWFKCVSEVIAIRGGETTEAPELELRRNPFAIAGVAYAADGRPASNLTVYYSRTDGVQSTKRDWQSAQSDSDGHFTIGFDEDATADLWFEGRDARWGEQTIRLVATGRTDLDVRLPEPLWIDLLVQDRAGAPITVFTVRLSFPDDDVYTSSTTRPHPQGTDHVMVRARPFVLGISADGRPAQKFGPYDLDKHPSSLVVTLEDPVPQVRVRVTAGGTPVAKARVELRQLDGRGLYACCGFPTRVGNEVDNWRRFTDDGRWSTGKLGEGRFEAIVRTPGFAHAESATFELGANAPKDEIPIALTRGGSVEGHVIPGASNSVGGVLVGISNGNGSARTVRVDGDGEFRFDRLAPGHWFARRCSREYAADDGAYCEPALGVDPSLTSFDVVEGRTTHCDLDLRDATCTLDGELKGVAGNAEAWSATLTAARITEYASQTIPLDVDGRFHAEPANLGAYRLVLADSGDDQRDQRIEQTVEIQRGANKWSLSLATGTLEGEAPANALLAHTWTSASGATCITHFLVDAQGRFHVDGVPAGAGRVQVVRANTDFEPVNLDVIAGDVTHVSVR